MKTPKLDPTKLTSEQRDKLEQYQQTQEQLRTLQDIADMSQELVNILDKQEETGKGHGALLADMREIMTALKDREPPESPDYAKPVVEAVSKLEKTLSASIKAIDVKPTIDAPQVNVSPPHVDLKGVEKAVKDIPKAFEQAIKLIPKIEIPKTDNTDLLAAWEGISEQLLSIETATRLKPQLPTTLKVTNPDGSVISGGSGGGDLHTALKGATASGYPTSTAASADRQPLDVTLRDTSGAPVAVGGGTQYADGAARGTATGTIAMVDDGTNIQSLSGDSTGKLNVNNISGTVSLPTGAATSAAQTDKSQFTKLTDGTNTALVTAAGEQNVLATAQPGVDIGDVTINNASGASAVNIQDGGNSITVDGTVAVSGTVTTAGTVTEANSAAILTSTQLLDDTVATLGTTTYTEATTKGNVIGAVRRDANTTLVDTTNEVAPLQVNATGELKVAQIQALPTGANVIGALIVNQSVNVAQVNGVTPLMGNGVTGTGSNRVTIASDGTAISTVGYMSVKLDQTTPGTTNATSLAQLGANTVATGNGASSTGVLRVAQVNDGTGVLAGVTTVSTVTSVTQNADVRQATASNLNAQVVGNIAHDGVDSGNPIKVGGKARQTNPTAVADLDRVDATFDDIGRQVVVLNQVRDLEIHQTTTITASTAETTILTAAAAGVFHDITLLTIANTSATATRVDIRDATAGSVIWSMYVPAGQQIGANITVPVKQTTAANNWTATCITSLTDLRIFVQGVKNV